MRWINTEHHSTSQRRCLSGMLICDEIELLFSYFWVHTHIQVFFMILISVINKLTLSSQVKRSYFFFCTKMQQESKQYLIKLFCLLFSHWISNTQTPGFYYTFIRDNGFTALRQPYVSVISRKILLAGRLTVEVSWRCFLTFSAHINVANSDFFQQK